MLSLRQTAVCEIFLLLVIKRSRECDLLSFLTSWKNLCLNENYPVLSKTAPLFYYVSSGLLSWINKLSLISIKLNWSYDEPNWWDHQRKKNDHKIRSGHFSSFSKHQKHLNIWSFCALAVQMKNKTRNKITLTYLRS